MPTRRCFLRLLPAGLLDADEAAEVRDLFARMAEALSTGSPTGFLQAFDRRMPGYRRLERQVFALANQFEVASSLEFLEETGNRRQRSVTLDWMLEIRSLAPAGPTERRRQVVKATLERRGRSWRITALEPLEFFAPGTG